MIWRGALIWVRVTARDPVLHALGDGSHEPRHQAPAPTGLFGGTCRVHAALEAKRSLGRGRTDSRGKLPPRSVSAFRRIEVGPCESAPGAGESRTRPSGVLAEQPLDGPGDDDWERQVDAERRVDEVGGLDDEDDAERLDVERPGDHERFELPVHWARWVGG